MKIKSCSYMLGVKNIAPTLKNLSQINTIAIESPEEVLISTKQIKGAKLNVVVSKGDEVKIGSKVAINGENVLVSSVSGVVKEVKELPSVYGGTSEVVVIQNNFKDEKETYPILNINTSTQDEFLTALKSYSIIDYDGETLLNKITSIKDIEEKTLVVNILTDEPYQHSSLALISEKAEEIVDGVQIASKTMGATNVVVAFNKKEQNLVNELLTLLIKNIENLTVCSLPNRYPVGDELQLIKTITKKNLKNISEVRSLGYVSFDVFSFFALNELIKKGEVVSTRPISIIEKSGNKIATTLCWPKIGTTVKHIVSALMLNGIENVRKLVAGGPMRGIALGNENVGITFNLKSIMAIKDKIEDEPKELPCITCGKCVKVCPMGLVPYEIEKSAENKDFSEAVKYGAGICTKCGLCGFVCPSRRHITQRIVYAKEIIENKGLRNE